MCCLAQDLVNARALMPLQPESLIKIYRSKRNLGSSRPVIVAVGDTMHEGIPFGEFYVFHTFSDVPFLYSRSVCGFVDEWSPVDFGKYPEVFSASVLLESSFRSARDRFEYEASMHDRALFSQAPPLDFEEVDESPLIQFRVFQIFTSECTKMFGFSRSNAIRDLKEKVQQYPVVKLVLEPKV
jgi:hypothetical protein